MYIRNLERIIVSRLNFSGYAQTKNKEGRHILFLVLEQSLSGDLNQILQSNGAAMSCAFVDYLNDGDLKIDQIEANAFQKLWS